MFQDKYEEFNKINEENWKVKFFNNSLIHLLVRI